MILFQLFKKIFLLLCLSVYYYFVPGVGAASSGKLTFMVGGAEEEFNAAKELLSCMGANVVYCGQVGTGQVRAKITNE